MKGITILLNLVIVSVVVASKHKCPVEQETNWTIEKLLRHEDCNKFYKCTFGVPIEFQCYGDLHFNLKTWQCDWQFNVDCTDRNVPTPAPSSTISTSTTLLPTSSPSSTPVSTTTTITSPAPTTTTTTTSTTTTTPTTTTIPTTTTPTTTTTTTTTTPAPTTTTPTTITTPAPTTSTQATTANPDSLPNGCPVDPYIHRLLPHETDCSLFYYCVWGQLVLRECGPSGLSANGRLHFNKDLQICDWPSRAACAKQANSFNKHLDGRLAMMAR